MLTLGVSDRRSDTAGLEIYRHIHSGFLRSSAQVSYPSMQTETDSVTERILWIAGRQFGQEAAQLLATQLLFPGDLIMQVQVDQVKHMLSKSSPVVISLFMVSSFRLMVEHNSIMTHCDTDSQEGGDHLIDVCGIQILRNRLS